ncbi:hypothetical protein NE686_18310 [Tissierella carlieri]|uniref:PepSY domain-containing protein n=1 Tax=Tissierella carlieri TaxID=689904 RepID=A0ABT1SEZ8_9FIRM|nr:hypothetical protein [Tissierella carlieri]MCQ4925061.1 hypothetical protein [Tissierella carlieri]
MEKKSRKKYVISKQSAVMILTFVMCFSLTIGFFVAKGIALGPKTEEDSMKDAYFIQQFIEEEIEKNKDLKAVKTEAKKLGKEKGLVVAFVNSENIGNTKVNILLDLNNKTQLISSFEIKGGI